MTPCGGGGGVGSRGIVGVAATEDAHQDHHHPRHQHQQQQQQEEEKERPLRILYIVTTLAEYNTGSRSTVKGSDRLQLTLIPVLREGVESMLAMGYQVDVYLICHFSLRPERLALIRASLPSSPSLVQLEVWDDATPLGYSLEHDKNRTQYITRALARQHRFVIKDKLLHYDVFVNFEDDMLIKGEHVQQYVQVSNELYRLRELAPNDKRDNKNNNKNNNKHPRDTDSLFQNFHGPLTKTQLSRMIPGWIRVEVLLDEDTYGAQVSTGPIPLNLTQPVSPQPCCHVSSQAVNEHMPASPQSSKIVLWETNIIALGVRQMPVPSFLDWVVLQRGPSQESLRPHEIIGDYWAGRNGAYGTTPRPHGRADPYINNQGGWMATRRQIWEWHTELCPGGFLPPFDDPHFRYDGLDLRNVEYWSGGLSMFTSRHACGLQRIIPLDPQNFSRHLLYHTANNKQRQLASRRDRFTKADTLLGQLNHVKQMAEQTMQREMQQADH